MPESYDSYGKRAKVVNKYDVFARRMNEDAMVTEQLAEGIRNFAEDALKLEEFACDICS